jgi:hypothetical protein
MWLNTHGPMVISMRRKTKGSWDTDIGYGLSRQKNWGKGTKVCILKQSQPQVRLDWSLSQFWFLGEVLELLSGGCSVPIRVCCWG